jgi:hypothetical protein
VAISMHIFQVDLLEVYQIMHNLEGLGKEDFYKMADPYVMTRGYGFKFV